MQWLGYYTLGVVQLYYLALNFSLALSGTFPDLCVSQWMVVAAALLLPVAQVRWTCACARFAVARESHLGRRAGTVVQRVRPRRLLDAVGGRLRLRAHHRDDPQV